jgi:uncharacterized membrane protein
MITVDIDTTGLCEGSHSCSISISSNGGEGTFTVVVGVLPRPAYGVDLFCGDSRGSVVPGEGLVYAITVRNIGGSEDRISLVCSASSYNVSSWIFSLDKTSVDLGPGASTTVFLTVTALPGARDGDSINITVTGISHSDASKSDSVSITATVSTPSPTPYGDTEVLIQLLWVLDNAERTHYLGLGYSAFLTIATAVIIVSIARYIKKSREPGLGLRGFSSGPKKWE